MLPFEYGASQNLLSPSPFGPAIEPPVHSIKVNGRNGVEAFKMPPNSDAVLVDKLAPIIWFVQTDGAGYKTATPYDISLHVEQKPEDAIKRLEERIASLEDRINVKSNNGSNKQWKSEQHSNDAGARSEAKGRIPSTVSTEPSKE